MKFASFLLSFGFCILYAQGTKDGFSFDGRQMIRMRFDEAEGLPASNFDTLRVGFKTRRKQGLLMQIVDENGSDYVSLAMNNNGGVEFILNKWYPYQVNTDQIHRPGEGLFHDCADGSQHEVTVRRTDGGKYISMEVTAEETGAVVVRAESYLGNQGYGPLVERPHFLYIGNNGTSTYRGGYIGCITDMQIDDFYPLAEMTDDSTPSYVEILTAQKGCSLDRPMTGLDCPVGVGPGRKPQRQVFLSHVSKEQV